MYFVPNRLLSGENKVKAGIFARMWLYQKFF